MWFLATILTLLTLSLVVISAVALDVPLRRVGRARRRLSMQTTRRFATYRRVQSERMLKVSRDRQPVTLESRPVAGSFQLVGNPTRRMHAALTLSAA
ncbi:MAG: hypothetical protein ACYS22_13220 [Planctomycetota bacterium]|jgi:hypothetical protein